MKNLRHPIAYAIACVGVLALPAISLVSPVEAQVADPTEIADVTCDPVARAQAAPEPELVSFDPQVPERIIDTRDGTGGVDEALDAGCTLRIDTSGIGEPDTEITAFALSVTVISPDLGFFTAFPCAAGQPGTSSVNARAGIPTPNLVVGVPDDDGMVCLFSQNGGNVVIDVSGWWADGENRFTPIEPTRAYDTRELENPVKLPADAVRDVEIAGLIVPEDAVSITLNVAIVAPEENGFLVVYPCGFPVPLASNLNFVAGERRAVSAIVDLGPMNDIGARGRLCVSTSAETHFLVDVTGYIAPSASTSPDVVIQPLADTRIVDTRESGVPGTRFTAGTTQRFDLSGVIGRPDESVAVVLNAIAVQAEEESFLSITPCTAGPPATSSLNYDLDQTANLVVTALSADGEICVFAQTAVDVVIDLVGVVTGPPDSLVNQLSFSEVDGTLLPLDQPFVADAADYTTQCDGERTVGLRLGLAPRVTASINGVEVAERDAVAPDLPITLTDDGLVTIELTRGSETVTYFVRCLPPDFPIPNVEVADGATPGWYLTDLSSTNPDLGNFLAIFDERGVPVWYLRLDRNLIDARLLSTGDIAAAPNPRAFTTDPTDGHRIIALDGTLVDVQVGDDDAFPADKHDYVEIPELPEGRAIISYPLQTVNLIDLNPDAIAGTPAALQCDAGDPADDTDNGVIGEGRDIVGASIREVSGDDTLEWEWDARDHFSVRESTFPLCFKNFPEANPMPGGRPPAGEVDLFHINSLFRVVENGCEPTCDYIAGARHLDAVFRIDRTERDPDGPGPLEADDGYIEWILSSTPTDFDDSKNKKKQPVNVLNDPRYDAPRLNIVNDPLGGPLRMHDARLDGDVLTMHDNRTSSGQPSRFVEYRIDTSDPDSSMWTATLLRQIDAPFGNTSGSLGSARAADDGSVVVGWGRVATAPRRIRGRPHHRTASGLLRRWRVGLPCRQVPGRRVRHRRTPRVRRQPRRSPAALSRPAVTGGAAMVSGARRAGSGRCGPDVRRRRAVRTLQTPRRSTSPRFRIASG